jgi:hypothetical protein
VSRPTIIIGVDPGVTSGVCVIGIVDGKWRLERRESVKDVRDGAGLADLRCALGLKLDFPDGVVTAVAMEELRAYMTSAQEKCEAQGVVSCRRICLRFLSICTPPPPPAVW